MIFTLKDTTPTAKITLETELGEMTFEVKRISRDQMVVDYPGVERTSERIRAALVENIVGWNFDQPDGSSWPCDKETKEKVVPQIVGVKGKPKGEPGEFYPAIGILIFNFAVDEENFLKN